MRGTPAKAGSHRGAALFVVIILVLLLGLLTTAALRASLFSTSVASNTRVSALAHEAAEAALRYCEKHALVGSSAVVPIFDVPDDGEPEASRWKDRATWRRPGNVSTPIPAEMLNTASSKQTYPSPPECLIERLRLPTTPGTAPAEAYLITARGFSPDAVLAPDGALLNGSEVWLQSTVRR